tara:strand:- start:168 stop:416 length:249 start_codon:yes stop_codon:yes gene_type:complete
VHCTLIDFKYGVSQGVDRMTENSKIVDDRRQEIAEEKQKNKEVSLMHNFSEDHWIHTLTGGKQVKVFTDRRKKDETIYKGIK